MVEENLYHRPDGKRECLTCKKNRNRKLYVPAGDILNAQAQAGDFSRVQSPEIAAKLRIASEGVRAIVDRPVHAAVAFDEFVEEETVMCSYTEYDGESGETMACGKPEHSAKVKHGNWRKV
jgi:hypothetical protein